MELGSVSSSAAPETSFLPSRPNPSTKADVAKAAASDGGMMPDCPHMGGGAVATEPTATTGQHLNVKA